jgi:hypothetical protein
MLWEAIAKVESSHRKEKEKEECLEKSASVWLEDCCKVLWASLKNISSLSETTRYEFRYVKHCQFLVFACWNINIALYSWQD